VSSSSSNKQQLQLARLLQQQQPTHSQQPLALRVQGW
jgi:hypothetical protein